MQQEQEEVTTRGIEEMQQEHGEVCMFDLNACKVILSTARGGMYYFLKLHAK